MIIILIEKNYLDRWFKAKITIYNQSSMMDDEKDTKKSFSKN